MTYLITLFSYLVIEIKRNEVKNPIKTGYLKKNR